ncbi:MAG: permease [Beijerinckiaceae bacterium]
MIEGMLFPAILGVILSAIAWRRSPAMVQRALRSAFGRFVEIMPKIAIALLAAGFIGKLVPAEVVGRYIGQDSGLFGIMLATIVGGITPAGPIVSFPIVIVMLKAGAGFPQVVAFLTAWSVFALHRVMIYEIPMMGWRFSAVRLASSAILPPLAAYIVMGAMALFGAPAKVF